MKLNIKVTFTDGVVELFENCDGAAMSGPESFLDVFQDQENDHSFDMTNIASIEVINQEVKTKE
jgi:hypothetical protein